MALTRHPLNITTLTIFFPFATIPAALHYFSTVWLFSPQYGMSFFSLFSSHVAPSPVTTTLLSPPLAIHPLPSLYLAPTVEHYPLGLTFCTVPLVITFGFRIRSLIHLPFHTPTPASLFHSHSLPPPGRHPSTNTSLLPAILPIQAVSRAQWVREFCEDWRISDLSLSSRNMDGEKCAHNHWFLVAQTQKIGISLVAASEDDTCDQNGNPSPHSPRPQPHHYHSRAKLLLGH